MPTNGPRTSRSDDAGEDGDESEGDDTDRRMTDRFRDPSD